jgi:prefoldin subunit 5
MSELAPTISNAFQPNFNFLKSNKEVIRIIAEVLVFIGICYYFNSKNTKTLKHIEDLSQRLEEQEDENEKMRNTISTLTNSVDELTRAISQKTEPFKPKNTSVRKQPVIIDIKQAPVFVTNTPKPPVETKVEKTTPVYIEEIEDLDTELESELGELSEKVEKEDDGLD